VDAPAEAVSPDPPQAVNEIAIAAVKSAAVNFLLIILSSSFYAKKQIQFVFLRTLTLHKPA
jgi:hypothetical protein